MTWITTCTAPDLDHLDIPVIAGYLLNLVFTCRGGHNDPQVRSYVHAYILCTDKALRTYNAGRSLLLQYAQSENRTVLLFEGLADFETCISTVKRCLSLTDKMASHRLNPGIERTERRQLESYQKAIRPVRDAIEHMEKDIARGGIVPGTSIMLAVTNDGSMLEIGQHQLTFADLGACLTQLYTLAQALASREHQTSGTD
ncbi:MAG: hypothetical protein K2Y07_03605 [Nitrosomonas sp.]|nr:hypothetical protein [Nitrosomonas sp.]